MSFVVAATVQIEAHTVGPTSHKHFPKGRCPGSARFLFVSQEGAIPDVAATVRAEGHEARMCILDPHERKSGTALVTKPRIGTPTLTGRT